MNNLKLIYKSNPLYPQKLLTLKNPPELLFAIGNLKLLNTFSIAIVGARKFNQNSKLLTQNLAKELSIRNVTILSGMADGIDSIAHESCIDSLGKTIAILGNGFNISKSKNIFNRILENDGLILSEYFPDIPAFKYNFPRRNEIIVALSDGIVAVEVHPKSGTLITAKQALNQNKKLFTFPGDLNNSDYIENNLLLTKGANCIISYKDIIKNYPNINFEKKRNNKKYSIPSKYLNIYSILDNKPQDINIISRKLNIPSYELQSNLILMEIEGFVSKLPNNCYIKN